MVLRDIVRTAIDVRVLESCAHIRLAGRDPPARVRARSRARRPLKSCVPSIVRQWAKRPIVGLVSAHLEIRRLPRKIQRRTASGRLSYRPPRLDRQLIDENAYSNPSRLPPESALDPC